MKALKDRMEEEIGSSLFVFELLGLQCFSLKSLTPENVNKRPTILRTIYMILLFCCIFALTARYVSYDRTFMLERRTPKDLLIFVIQNSMNFGMILVILSSFIQSYASTETIKKVYLNSKEIAQLCFDVFMVVVDFKKAKEAAWKRILKGIVFLATLHTTVIFWHMQTNGTNLLPLLVLFPTSYLLMITFKYVFYVAMVNDQLIVLQEFLERMLNQIKVIETVNSRSIQSADDPFPLCKLRTLWKIYNIIYENGTLINDSQGLTILIILASLIVALSVSGYHMLVILIGGMPFNQLPGNNKLISSELFID